MLVAEDGPWDLIARLRGAAGTVLGRLMDCFYCSSFWVAAPFAFALSSSWIERLLFLPALSGGAMLLERLTDRSGPPPPAPYIEGESEESNAVLRR